MKTALPVALIACLAAAGCSTPAPKTDTAKLQLLVEIKQPKIDLPNSPRHATQTATVSIDRAARTGSPHVVKFGAYTAVECDQKITNCKHAVVLPVASFNVEKLGNGTASLQGMFDVTVGRSITDAFTGGASQTTTTRNISDTVEVIEEGKFSFPLKTTLVLDQPYAVEGRLGTRVTFTLQAAPTYP